MKKILILLFIVFCFVPSASAKKVKTSIPEGSGYVGTLPNISDFFPKTETEETKPSFDYQEGFNDPDSIKPAPRNNPSFVNIIMKKDKTSQYINDLNDLIFIIEKVQTCIEDSDNVQKFNAKAYFLKENVEYFRDKYKDKAEGSYISFKEVMKLNTHIQSVAQLRLESEVYSPYVTAAQSGNMFSENNIDSQLDYLLQDIKQSLVVLKDTK